MRNIHCGRVIDGAEARWKMEVYTSSKEVGVLRLCGRATVDEVRNTLGTGAPYDWEIVKDEIATQVMCAL